MKKALCYLVAIMMIAAVAGCSGTQPTQSGEPAGTAASGGKAIPDEIKIGLVAPISGQQAIDGRHMSQAIQVVEDELAAAGGLDVDGKKVQIKFIIEDNEAKPDISVNAVQKLIEQDKVLAIIGPNNSKDILASGEVAQQAKIPEITNYGTNIAVTQIGDYIFRACFIDPFQGKVLARFAANDLKAKTVGILYNNADAYSVGLKDAFEEEFKELGCEVVASEAYGGSDVKDFNAQFTIIKNANPDVLFLPNIVNDLPLQLKQARAMGIEAPFLGGDSWDYDSVPEVAGTDIIEGAYYACPFSPDAESAREFVAAYSAKFPESPSSSAALTYEAAHIVLKGIQTAKTIDGPGIRDAMAAVNMDLPSGHITFDENRNPVKGAVIMTYNGGERHYVTTVNP